MFFCVCVHDFKYKKCLDLQYNGCFLVSNCLLIIISKGHFLKFYLNKTLQENLRKTKEKTVKFTELRLSAKSILVFCFNLKRNYRRNLKFSLNAYNGNYYRYVKLLNITNNTILTLFRILINILNC